MTVLPISQIKPKLFDEIILKEARERNVFEGKRRERGKFPQTGKQTQLVGLRRARLYP